MAVTGKQNHGVGGSLWTQLRAASETEYVRECCRRVVDEWAFVAAWVGYQDGAGGLRPVARACRDRCDLDGDDLGG